ncbi:glucosidase 2 subunit beta-like isoform X1 [Patiria miniata]|uniref:Glucosidase 2 subunit beta n=1 Tax=Patiria miniata TaxID=46514 RepID=A0A914BFK9_PATMI|nr:glucosidase 2 subunit beta-like isoform X1 [Patiria miniata]
MMFRRVERMAACVSDMKAKKMSVKSLITLVLIGLMSIIDVVVTESVTRPRGVSLTNEPFYRDSQWFTCLDGSRQIFKSQVNDDYCDCMDSSDEPGTSACPQGKFHCNNRGFKPKYIPSSRVNDGICDCCDASDEYKGPGATQCSNNCRELGRADLERRQQEIILMNQGFDVRQEYIKQGIEKKAEREESLKKLREEKEVADQLKDEKERLKQEAESPEKEAKDAHKAVWDAQQAVLREERDKQRANEAFDELDADRNGLITPDELADHKEFDSDGDGEVSEEEAKVVLGGVDQVIKPTFTASVWAVIKDKYKSEKDQVTPEDPSPVPSPPEDVNEGDASEEDLDMGDHGDMNDEDEEDFADEDDEDEEFDDDLDEGELMEKYAKHRADYEKKKEVKGKGEDGEEMPEYDEATKKLIEVADAAREEFKEAEKQVNDLKKSIEDIEKLMNVDLGPQQEFEPLQKQCYEYTDREYTYKLCPFDKTSQRPKAGGSETQLGNWGQWEGPDENKYSKMKYTRGRNCWNGPDRSTLVILRCGLENKLVSASEPERCTYEFQFETPSLCTTKTDVETGEIDSHDEL